MSARLADQAFRHGQTHRCGTHGVRCPSGDRDSHCFWSIFELLRYHQQLDLEGLFNLESVPPIKSGLPVQAALKKGDTPVSKPLPVRSLLADFLARRHLHIWRLTCRRAERETSEFEVGTRVLLAIRAFRRRLTTPTHRGCMLQEPLSKPLPWDRNRASAVPLTGPPSHPLPPPPTASFRSSPVSRPGVSSRLSAVMAFSRQVSRTPSPSVPVLDANTINQTVDMQNQHPNPPIRGPSQSTATRPSSRRALTAALELAQEAVRLDTTNDDPIGAIQAYSRSVALLSEVMERVMRGEDTSDTGRDRRRSGRRRSVVAKEEEVRRLKSIVSPPASSLFQASFLMISIARYVCRPYEHPQ